MGRLVGLGGALVVIAVVGLFLGFGAYFVEDNEGTGQEGVPAAPPEAKLVDVDPACLWPVLDASFSPDAPSAPNSVSLEDCAPADAETTIDRNWARVSLQRGDPDAGDFERRFSGARVAHLADDGRLTIEAYDNWGGSGVFSSLITGEISADGTEMSEIKAHGFGDRCNGGLAGTHAGPEGRVIASVNMTPWDIMVAPFAGQSFEAQWAAAQERYGAAVGNAPSCAACCSAVTREYEVAANGTLVSIGLRYSPRQAGPSDDPLSVCLERAVRDAGGEDGVVADDELGALSLLIDGCAKVLSE